MSLTNRAGKQLKWLLASGLLFLAAAACHAPQATAAEGEAGLRMAVVRIQDIFSECQRSKVMKADIEVRFKPEQEKLEKVRKNIEMLKENLRNDRTRAPGGFAWFASMQEIKTKEYYLKTEREEVTRRWNESMVAFYKRVYKDFQAATKLYAEKNGYDLVVRVASPGLNSDSFVGIQNEIGLKILHYFSPRLDKTQQVLDIMDRLYQAAKAKAAEGN